MSLFEGNEVNETTLTGLKYHQLKEAFTELGIPEVWKQGRKGKTMIAEALGKLEALKGKIAEGADEETQNEENSEENTDTQESSSDAQETDASESTDDDSDGDADPILENEIVDFEEIKPAEKEVSLKYDGEIEDLLESLRITELNIQNGIQSHRVVLLNKKNEYVARLKELGVEVES